MAPSQNIIKVLYSDWIKPHRRKITFCIVFAIFLIAGYYSYLWYAKSLFQENFEQDIANRNTRVGEAYVYCFSAKWCPHCKRAQPEWEKFKASVNGTTVKNYTVRCVDVDCSEGNDPRIQKYKVNGYPTVVMEKDGTTINLDSRISQDTLQKFVNEML